MFFNFKYFNYVITKLMENFKSISEILSNKGNKEELYVSDQKKRKWRSNKGLYTKNKGTFDFIHLIKQWDQIVGKMMADNTIPLKIYKSSLIISAKHPIFAQELGFLAPMIIEKIHASFPELKSKVSKIKFSNSNKQICRTFEIDNFELLLQKISKVIKNSGRAFLVLRDITSGSKKLSIIAKKNNATFFEVLS